MSEKGKQKETNKKVYSVPSRYKQAVERTVLSSNSRERTFLKGQVSGNSSQNTLNCTELCSSQSNRGMTSTPASKGGFLLPSLDASTVQKIDSTKPDTKSSVTVPYIKAIASTSTDCVRKNLARKNKFHNETVLPCGPVVVSHKDKKKTDTYNEKVAVAQMNLLYAQYLQAAILESESRKALQMRASTALESIHKLFGLVLLHMEKARSQQRHLETVSFLLKVHEHCEKQEEIFKPVFEMLPMLDKQYKSLAEAVNCTKHKLHVENVIIPEPGSEGEVMELLHKLTSFIEEFLKEFSNVAEINLSADILQNYIGAAEQISVALKRGLNLTTEARDLTLSEASLALGCEHL